MGIVELFYFCGSQELKAQFQAFVCLTAWEELMNGLFNKTSQMGKSETTRTKKLKKRPKPQFMYVIQTTLASSDQHCEREHLQSSFNLS